MQQKILFILTATILVFGLTAANADTQVPLSGRLAQGEAVPRAQDDEPLYESDTITDTMVVPEPPRDTLYRDERDGSGPAIDTIGDLSATETQQLQRRKESYRFNTFGLGPAWFSDNIESDDVSYNFYAGKLYEVNPHAAIKSLLEVTTDFQDAVMADAVLGANLYILNTDLSPYLGLDLGIGYANVNNGDDNVFGFDLGASVGIQMFRLSNVQLNLEGKARTLLNDIGDENPVVYAIRVGLLF